MSGKTRVAQYTKKERKWYAPPPIPAGLTLSLLFRYNWPSHGEREETEKEKRMGFVRSVPRSDRRMSGEGMEVAVNSPPPAPGGDGSMVVGFGIWHEVETFLEVKLSWITLFYQKGKYFFVFSLWQNMLSNWWIFEIPKIGASISTATVPLGLNALSHKQHVAFRWRWRTETPLPDRPTEQKERKSGVLFFLPNFWRPERKGKTEWVEWWRLRSLGGLGTIKCRTHERGASFMKSFLVLQNAVILRQRDDFILQRILHLGYSGSAEN